MTELIAHLALGFSVAFSLQNVMLCFIGCFVGTLIGVLPGIGPLATIAILLPITYHTEPVGSLIMLAGIYYGAQYGGSTTAILVNMPGEASSVVTTLDGHAMAQQGRAGKALGIAAIGSFVAGTFATLVIAALAIPLARFAIGFGPGEYFALMLLGLILAIVLAGGTLLKALAMLVLGVLMALVGADMVTAQARLTFGVPQLYDGFDVAIIAMGLFGIAEVLRNLELGKHRPIAEATIGRLLPGLAELRQSAGAITRGSLIGTVLGVLPGNGAILAPFAAYSLEKGIAKQPERLGKGAIEGVAAPEAANNGAAQTTFIPLLTLGIPSTAAMALMGGAMTLHGILPGPRVLESHPALFWGMIASMWIGNAMLLIINLPLIGIWVRFLRVPYRLLFPMIVLVCCIGIYSVNKHPGDVIQVGLFGLVGYLFAKLKFEPTPLLLGFVLGRLLEDNLRRGLVLSRGSIAGFLSEPATLALLVAAALVLVAALLPRLKRRRAELLSDDTAD
jgi:putative tricarboxylic transport membrane protein